MNAEEQDERECISLMIVGSVLRQQVDEIKAGLSVIILALLCAVGCLVYLCVLASEAKAETITYSQRVDPAGYGHLCPLERQGAFDGSFGAGVGAIQILAQEGIDIVRVRRNESPDIRLVFYSLPGGSVGHFPPRGPARLVVSGRSCRIWETNILATRRMIVRCFRNIGKIEQPVGR